MTQLMPLTVTGTSILLAESQATQPKFVPLRQYVREHLRQYFMRLEGLPSGLYDTMLTEVEPALLEMVLHRVGQNQSRAANILNISRGTLRKKMKLYGFLPNQHNGRNR